MITNQLNKAQWLFLTNFIYKKVNYTPNEVEH